MGLSQDVTMRILTGLAFLLAATAADAQTYTTIVNREAKTVTTTGPNATAVTKQVARTSNGATYSTTVTRHGGSRVSPTGSSGRHPLGAAHASCLFTSDGLRSGPTLRGRR